MHDFNGALMVLPSPEEINVYKFSSLPESEFGCCEGCSYATDDADVLGERRMYMSISLTSSDGSVLDYCQNCLEDLKKSYDKDPYMLSGFDDVPPPLFIAGTSGSVWNTL